MLKGMLMAVTVSLLASCPTWAQSALNSTADTGAGWHDASPTGHNSETSGWADYTRNQGDEHIWDPLLQSTGSMSGAATGAPIPGTFIAPANLALRQQGLTKLPPTRLDSFVFESGYNDHIYGDEGEWDKPPYDCFTQEHRIERGIWSEGLTTGHKSDAPEAWDYPN